MIIVDALKCWGPKLEFDDHGPTIHYNQFELVECNKGLQICSGGCKYCVNITGSFVAKSCAGDDDHGLEILELNEEGCKKITRVQNLKYTRWINRPFKQSKYSLVADFTQACSCSLDGCNGSPEHAFNHGLTEKTIKTYDLNLISSGIKTLDNDRSKQALLSFALMIIIEYTILMRK